MRHRSSSSDRLPPDDSGILLTDQGFCDSPGGRQEAENLPRRTCHTFKGSRDDLEALIRPDLRAAAWSGVAFGHVRGGRADAGRAYRSREQTEAWRDRAGSIGGEVSSSASCVMALEAPAPSRPVRRRSMPIVGSHSIQPWCCHQPIALRAMDSSRLTGSASISSACAAAGSASNSGSAGSSIAASGKTGGIAPRRAGPVGAGSPASIHPHVVGEIRFRAVRRGMDTEFVGAELAEPVDVFGQVRRDVRQVFWTDLPPHDPPAQRRIGEEAQHLQGADHVAACTVAGCASLRATLPILLAVHDQLTPVEI